MMSLYENPPASDGYVPKTEVTFFKPQNSTLFKMLPVQNPISLVDLLDQDLFKTPPDSEEEYSAEQNEGEQVSAVFAPTVAEGTQLPETRISEESDRGGEDENLVLQVEDRTLAAQVVNEIGKCSGPTQDEVEETILVPEESQNITKTKKKRKSEKERKEKKCKKHKRKIKDLVQHKEKSPSPCRSFSYEDLLNPCSPPKIKRSTYQESPSTGSSSKCQRSQSATICDDSLNPELTYSSKSLSCSRPTIREHKEEERHNLRKRLKTIEDQRRCPSSEDERNLSKTFSRPVQRLIDYSDSDSSMDAEPENIEEQSINLEVSSTTTTQESKEKSPCKIPLDDKETIKFDCKGFLLDRFYCKDCQLTLNSELTWESHIRGKKHMKVLKSQAIHEIAKSSISLPANPPFAAVDKPRFSSPTANRVRLYEEAKLQRTVDEITKHPMPGLNHVLEIRAGNEISYYCDICDASCGITSIMPHLTGSSHQMLCVKLINPEFYERVKGIPRKQYEQDMLKILFDHQREYHRGHIRVYKEKPDPSAIKTPLDSLYFDRPGPSWGLNAPMKPEHGRTYDSVPPSDECLDTSKSDFYCKLCDSHMNNFNMWASHIRGKRHLKNAKKIPGESISKLKSIKVKGVISELEFLLRQDARHEVVVGLDYIKETQGKNGEIYNCFLCGSCCTNLDIVDHVLQTKHRTKYLEKLLIDGKKNGIDVIAQMDINMYSRERLIQAECYKMEQLYGRGRVEVYISKSV